MTIFTDGARFNSRSRVGSDRHGAVPSRRQGRFNSRSRVGSDVSQTDRFYDDTRFQFTLPCRERHEGGKDALFGVVFQFTLPCRERLASSHRCSGRRMFQFTLPCRERPSAAGLTSLCTMFQFTLPCRERQLAAPSPDGVALVSIHAPV